MEIPQPLIAFGISILIGGLIGVERERTKTITKGLSAVGVRTDILISLFGAFSAYLGLNYNPVIFIICLIGLLIMNIISYTYLLIKHGRIGITTEISTILVFLYGAYTMYGSAQIAVTLAIVTTIVLSMKDYLNNFIQNLDRREFFDAIKFAFIAFIILPLLPNTNFDDQIFHLILPAVQFPEGLHQLQILNPYRIWLIVVVVSGISFLGYILIKIFGKNRGIIFSGLVGGLYSSTTTSLTLASKSKELPKTKKPFVAGIILACAVSFIRTYIQIGVLNTELLARSFLPISMMFIYLLVTGLILAHQAGKETIDSETNFESPFSLKKAIQLGSLIIGALLVAKILLSYAGINWYFIIAGFLAFFAIDDPIVISTSMSIGSLIDLETGKNIIIMVTFLNMIQKSAMIYIFGNKKLFPQLFIIFSGLFLVSLVSLFYF